MGVGGSSGWGQCRNQSEDARPVGEGDPVGDVEDEEENGEEDARHAIDEDGAVASDSAR